MTPYVLYARYSSLIERVDLAGGNRRTVYSGGYPRALTFDYRCLLVIINPCNHRSTLRRQTIIHQYTIHCCCRNDYIFWTDTNSDRIYRARTNGSSPMIIVNAGLSCAGILYLCKSCCKMLNVVDRWTGLGLGE